MNSPHRTPDWLLERIALGELPPEELAKARARLAEEPDGLARLAALEADSRATLERLPPARVAREVEARAARMTGAARKETPSPSWRLAWGLVPALATVALFVLARPADVEDTRSGGPVAVVTPGMTPERTRIKGLEPRLAAHRQAGAGSEPLTDGALVAAGDVLQLEYVAAGRTHGVIVSVDGRGAVTLHAPEEGSTRAAALAPSGTHRLPGAYELDDAPEFERFFFVSSEEPFDVAPVLDAARALAGSAAARSAPLSLPQGLTQVSFTLEKQR
ncbi:ActD-like protein [Pyxidicoccus fallax]|uniref:ActD-like protein n=1 Tax=Pyxidicoccus fallax TaxID=394095 RepID=A0A848LZH7_9BACT|nr:ActD-like protein [Pyxidicoccus fallax]NMO23527.1 ActD-like protein [Pyxidicoccus fallax]NPC86828.1 ActD-like protein [Pyxidicoccus fallax]